MMRLPRGSDPFDIVIATFRARLAQVLDEALERRVDAPNRQARSRRTSRRVRSHPARSRG
jgi:hypothetical protein